MELRIEPYHALSSLPEMCGACLYWENPQAFRARLDISTARAQKREWVQERGGGATSGFVAYDGDVPVGFCHFALAPFFPMLQEYELGSASPDAIFIACLHIVPSVQGLGVGQRLRECVETHAAQDGVPAVETMARMHSADNPSGPIAFWQKNGYAIMRCHGEFALVRKDILPKDTNGKGEYRPDQRVPLPS